MLLTAEIITIGDEILYGQILDTNSKWISAELDAANIKLIRKTCVADSAQAIKEALSEALSRAKFVLLTGGLGPTPDDLTKNALADFFDDTLVLHPQALVDLEQLMASKERPLNALTRLQAMHPSKADYLPNRIGTAPGIWFEKENQIVVALPGVPAEVKILLTEQVLPLIHKKFPPTHIILHRMARSFGIAESVLASKIEHWEKSLPDHIKLAYLPTLAQVRLRLSAVGRDKAILEQECDRLFEQLEPLVGTYIYAYEDIEITEAVGRLLKSKKLTMATAESCSAGFISTMVAQIPGSGAWLQGGVVAYQANIKKDVLGVDHQIIEQYGVVSQQTAIAMAQNVRQIMQADIGVSSTGIAGPATEHDEQPVGTIWIGYADASKSVSKCLKLGQDRKTNIELTALHTMEFIRRQLLGIE